ncbi:MAG: tetratricopeptide repeat protein [Verrucomicrobiae bacterium]|nr:tetratricopeptide repeat protein [Verrucomicrobiae bacterium]
MRHELHSSARFRATLARRPAGLALIVCLMGTLLTGLKGQDPAAPAAQPNVDASGPQELIERGQAAFAANDFVAAELAMETFITEYGASEEAKKAVQVFTPMVAICKVGNRKFAEALVWIEKAFADPELSPVIADELSFWKGIALMTEGQLVEAQHAFGAYWADESHQPAKRYEALVLFATLYLQQGFPLEAADFLSSQLPKVRDQAPEAASRAVVLQLYSLIEAGELDRALVVVREQYPKLSEMTQVISFQTLALQLGSRLLEDKRWYDAIACLQRISPRDRLLKYQQERKADIESRIEQHAGNPAAQSIVFQLQGILRRVEREISNFEKIENFDSALRFRLATAFQGMGRYRESALVMEDMLRTMPPDAVVESASLALIQCWMEIGRWPKAVEAADLYAEKFGETGHHLATVLFLKAEALREDQQLGKAQLAYGDLVERFPDDPVAPKAIFMQGFLYLQQDDNEGALYQFDQVAKKHSDSSLVDDADYWSGMALSFSKDYAGARDHMRAYLEKFGKGGAVPKYQKEAIFRIAVCTFSMAEYPESIHLLKEFVANYPGDALVDEAQLLLGDALFSEGDIENGIVAYQAIRPESTRFFEDGWFKIGKAHKLTEEFDAMREHFERFVQLYPDSRRMPEAVYWLGWIDTQNDRLDKARDTYWDTIALHGNRTDLTTMEDLMLALPKVYQPDGDAGREVLLKKLEDIRILAETGGRDTLALRCAWARAKVLERISPEQSRAALLATSALVDPKVHNPMITVDCADAQMEAGNRLLAKELFTEARRWHPRAIQKDRIYAGLGQIAEAEGEIDEAISFYEKFEIETAASSRLGEIRLAKARLLAQKGRTREARETMEALLADQASGTADKAAALVELGDLLVESGEQKTALPYYERVYVAYGKFGELNAKAYAKRAEQLEKLGMESEALEVYRELAGRKDLESFEEARLAPEKVRRLEAIVPQPVIEETAPVIPEGGDS